MQIAHPTFPGVTRDVSDQDADAWIDAGWRPVVPDPAPAGIDAPAPQVSQEPPWPDGDPHTTWTLAQLRAWSQASGLDLAGASTKAEILAAIAAQGTDDAAPVGA